MGAGVIRVSVKRKERRKRENAGEKKRVDPRRCQDRVREPWRDSGGRPWSHGQWYPGFRFRFGEGGKALDRMGGYNLDQSIPSIQEGGVCLAPKN